MATFSGDFAKLDELVRKLQGIPKLKARAVNIVAEGMKDLVLECFEDETDPYGVKWAANWRGGEVLADKGTMKASVYSFGIGTSATVGLWQWYASVHQSGKVIHAKHKYPLHFKVGNKDYYARTVKIPMRMMVPVDVLGLPPAWQRELETEVQDLLDAHFAGL